MIFITLSVALSLFTPPLFHLALKFKQIWQAFERLLMVFVAGLVTFHLLPESISLIGNKATLLAFAGLFLPSLMERVLSNYASQVHILAVFLGACGLFIHGVMDGAAMSLTHEQALPIAVLLHRLPSGILLCAMFHKTRGWGFVWAMLILSAIASILGFSIGAWVFRQSYGMYMMAHFQALVAGSILHIALDTHEPESSHNAGSHSH